MAQIFPKDDHDTIVRKFADLIQKNNPDKYQVRTFLDGLPLLWVGEHVPDIILYEPDSTPEKSDSKKPDDPIKSSSPVKLVLVRKDEQRDIPKKPVLVIEVETTDSVSEQRAEERWLPIFGEAKALQIIIPKGVASRVKRYCKKFGIKATFQEY
ncbi:MAG: hypothetical protein P9M15_08485 [Candidatus Electryoneaceae bacterium]|nr:hypothetical protein [Candidatus Electryoneaceae bacterium]